VRFEHWLEIREEVPVGLREPEKREPFLQLFLHEGRVSHGAAKTGKGRFGAWGMSES
jgi:hypothetical protein